MIPILFSGLLMIASMSPQDSVGVANQGIEGTVRVLGGNRMPAPGTKRPSAGPGVAAVVCIFRLTNISQVVQQKGSAYYNSVSSPLVRTVNTDDQGRFKVGLPPGQYSIFIKRNELYYASRRDEKNNIFPVEVLPGKMTNVELSVESDHRPVY